MQSVVNPATLAIACILATVGAVVWVAMHRQVLWPESLPAARRPPPAARRPPPAVRRRSPAARRRSLAARRRSLAARRPPKRAESVSVLVSPIATPDFDAEMISLHAVARLVAAGHVGQTTALECVFGVKAGSSKRYTQIVTKYKQAAAAVALELAEKQKQPDSTPAL